MDASSAHVPSQIKRLQQFDCPRAVDIHCHVLPGVDDGPSSMKDALLLCRALVADGLTDVVATPHQLGRWDGVNTTQQVRQATSELQSAIDAAGIPLKLHVGGEVRLDERIPLLLRSDQIATVADRRQFVLLELPSALTVEPAAIGSFFKDTGTRVILAHPERYNALQSDPASAGKWTDQGILLQVNAMSLLGDAGEHAENAAWEWMQRGLVSFVATDAHSTGARRPKMTRAIDEIVSRLGQDQAKRVCAENPRRLLEGLDIL